MSIDRCEFIRKGLGKRTIFHIEMRWPIVWFLPRSQPFMVWMMFMMPCFTANNWQLSTT